MVYHILESGVSYQNRIHIEYDHVKFMEYMFHHGSVFSAVEEVQIFLGITKIMYIKHRLYIFETRYLELFLCYTQDETLDMLCDHDSVNNLWRCIERKHYGLQDEIIMRCMAIMERKESS